MKLLRRFMADEHAAGMLEYGLLAGLIVVVTIAVIEGLGAGTSDVFTIVSREMPDQAMQGASAGSISMTVSRGS